MAGRPKGSLNKKTLAKIEAAKTAKASEKTCLKCRRTFQSRGPQNHLCWQCNAENESIYEPRTAHYVPDN